MIDLLVHYPPFIKEIEEEIRREMLGRPLAMSNRQGHFHGPVTDYHLLGPHVFSPAECVGSTCSIAFEGRGAATGADQTIPSGEITFMGPESPVLGTVDVAWPDEEKARTMEELIDLYPRIRRIVTVESAGLADE